MDTPTKIERGRPWDPMHVAAVAGFTGMGLGGLLVGVIKLALVLL